MVAPVDAKVELEAEGETITLRLNFRSISLLEEHGLDLFAEEGVKMTLSKSARMLCCLAVEDHPDLTPDQALAIIRSTGQQFGYAVIELIQRFGGKPSEDVGGNGEAADQAAA